MAKRSILDQLPGIITNELIEKLLTGEPYSAVRQWLDKQHGIKKSRSNVSRYGKATRDKFSMLVDLGMPIAEIVKHRQQIEALGIEQARRQLLNELTERNEPIFAYLGNKVGKQ